MIYRIIDFPETPTNLRTINVSRNSVLIAWTPGLESGYEQTFRIRYWKVISKESDSQTVPQYKYVIVNNTLNEVLISNLESDTEYQLSISARNRLGESLMSRDTLTVKTLPDVSKRKLESVLASADEQKFGYNKQKITEEMIEISVITSILVFFLLCLTSIVICCVRRQRRAQVHQKAAQKARNSNNSKEILLNSTTEERPFTISGSTTLDSECTVDTTVLEQHHNTDKCLYVEKRGNLLSNFAPNY